MYQRHSNHSQLMERYRNKTRKWQRNMTENSALVEQHTFHVAAWTTFVEEPAELQGVACLLTEMLQSRGRTRPVPRLFLALEHVRDRVQQLQDEDSEQSDFPWASSLMREVNRALARREVDFGGDTSHVGRATHAPPGTYGRTDQALVSRVLGDRTVPRGCSIRWDGHPARLRWYGNVPGHTHIPGSNATRSRFTDEAAIEHVYACIQRWAAENLSHE